MISTPATWTSIVGKGEWRISLDEDGKIMAVELWDMKSASIRSYEVLDIKHR